MVLIGTSLHALNSRGRLRLIAITSGQP